MTAQDVRTIYEVPLALHAEGLDERICEKLNIWTGTPNLSRWEKLVSTIKDSDDVVRIAMVGKYMDLSDSYKSLIEALVHGGVANDCRVEVVPVAARDHYHVCAGRNLRAVQPLGNRIHDHLLGVREPLRVGELLAVVDHVHLEAHLVRQPADEVADVPGAEHVDLG